MYGDVVGPGPQVVNGHPLNVRLGRLSRRHDGVKADRLKGANNENDMYIWELYIRTKNVVVCFLCQSWKYCILHNIRHVPKQHSMWAPVGPLLGPSWAKLGPK